MLIIIFLVCWMVGVPLLIEGQYAAGIVVLAAGWTALETGNRLRRIERALERKG